MTDPDPLHIAIPNRSEANRAVRQVAEAAHRLNLAIEQAVREGYTVELIRMSRVEGESGNWGDQMVPVIQDRRTHPEPPQDAK
jgi:hypothetical protein